jgi:hypothetical protein
MDRFESLETNRKLTGLGDHSKHVVQLAKDGVEFAMKNKKKTAAYLLIALISIFLLIPSFRWNTGLALYFSWFNLPLFEPLWRKYLMLEITTMPFLFNPVPIVEMDGSTFEWSDYLSKSKKMTIPVVIRGLFNKSVAMEQWGTEQWVKQHNDFSLTEFQALDEFQATYDVKKANFVDYMKDIRAGSYRYSYGLDELFTRYPELVNDLEYERYGRFDGRDFTFCRSIGLFISSSGKGFTWHNADAPNMVMQLKGMKHFSLIDPSYSLFLGPEVPKDYYSTGFSAKAPPYIFERIPKMNVTITPGDVLLVPSWWWHHVMSESYEDDPTKSVILNTCRFSEVYSAAVNNPVLEWYRHIGTVFYVHPSLPTVLRWIPYYRILQDSFREYFNLIPHWDDYSDCCSSKKKGCEQYFKSIGWEVPKLEY